MSLISSDTLFHFTPTRANLVGILTHEFRPCLSIEDFGYIARQLQSSDYMEECGIPMVSFCDIPLSQVETHMKHYGCYGVGLTKAWGIRKGIAPVMYAHENAPGPASIAKLISFMARLGQLGVPADEVAFALQPGILSYYLKPYRGILNGQSRSRESVCFYNEREWRYVPADVESVPAVSPRDLSDAVASAAVRAAVAALPPLGFDPWDINYILVEKESELLDMYYAVDDIKSNYTPDQRNLLKTKIVSAERIAADF